MFLTGCGREANVTLSQPARSLVDLHNEKFLEKIWTNLSYPEPETRSSLGWRLYHVAAGRLFRHRKGETCSCGPLVVAKEDLCYAILCDSM